MQFFKALFPAFLLAGTVSATVDSATFSALVRAAKLSQAAYETTCSKPGGLTKAATIRDSRYDTDGYIATDPTAKEIIVAFRGTSSLQDVIIDLRNTLTTYSSAGCSGCRVHQGFQQQWTAVSASVISTVRSLLTANPSYSLLITGHSLGGALVAISAPDIAAAFPDTPKTFIGFASPRVGNPTWANWVDSQQLKMYRVTHTDDNVPQDLTPADGYRHVATEYWISADPVSESNVVVCQGGEDAACNVSVAQPGQGLAGINAAHFVYMGIDFRNDAAVCS